MVAKISGRLIAWLLPSASTANSARAKSLRETSGCPALLDEMSTRARAARSLKKRIAVQTTRSVGFDHSENSLSLAASGLHRLG